MSKSGMPSCTAQTIVPPLLGCSAACRGACQATTSPNTTSSPSVCPESHAPRRTRRCLHQGRKLRMGHLLLTVICLVHVAHYHVLQRPASRAHRQLLCLEALIGLL